MTETPNLQVGQIKSWDFQADVFCGEYRLVEDLGNGEWVIEHLAPSAEILDRILDYYAGEEARRGTFSTCPVWDKTWAECSGDERPEITGYRTYVEEMEQEIAGREERAGETSTIKFVSSAKYAEAF